MLGVVSSASTHHISTERSSSDEISSAPHPFSKLSLMGIEECCVGNVINIPSNRDRDESILLGVFLSTSEQQLSKENQC